MTNDWLVFGAAVATLLLAVANAWGWLGPIDKRAGRADEPDGGDYRARAREIVAYLTSNPSSRSKAP